MPQTLTTMKVVILTPISVEYDAVRKHLPQLTEEIVSGNRYETALFKGKHHTLKIILHQTGSKNNAIGLATEKAVQAFEPQIVLLVGIAGGVKDVSIGDIVVGTKAYGYEAGKETADGFVTRPEVFNFSKDLISIAQSVHQKNTWQERCGQSNTPTKVVFGPIASGDKVIATTKAYIYPLLKKHFNDTVALEMEAIGFGQAMYHHQHILSLNIRGISDLLDGKSQSDAGGSQELAAGNAAAFAFELLNELDASRIKILNMDVKTIAKEVFDLVLPALKMEATQKIGNDFKEASNTTVSELWKKVKHLFIEEFDDLKEVTEDEDAPAVARKTLRKAMEKDDGLKGELEQLIKKIKPEGGVVISGSKNVVQGSTITAGGKVSVGDNTRIVQNINNHGSIEKQVNVDTNKGNINL